MHKNNWKRTFPLKNILQQKSANFSKWLFADAKTGLKKPQQLNS